MTCVSYKWVRLLIPQSSANICEVIVHAVRVKSASVERHCEKRKCQHGARDAQHARCRVHTCVKLKRNAIQLNTPELITQA